ncbi:tlde1 domain-containing protein, partial [Rhizobium ruizarguesonis]
TYMLGKNGDSNGCVSFKDYRRFLAAYKRGDIKQLVVVPRLNNKPSSTFASLFSSRS